MILATSGEWPVVAGGALKGGHLKAVLVTCSESLERNDC